MNTANQQNDNFGFYTRHGRFHQVDFPGSMNASPSVNQLLGVNDRDIAVGFYTDANGNNHGYTYNIGARRFQRAVDQEVVGFGPVLRFGRRTALISSSAA